MSYTAQQIVSSPYPGLRTFETDEAVIFFGRDEQVDELLSRLQQHRFLAVVGPSGCGKSSLIRAGMIPRLEGGFIPSTGSRWHVVIMRPGVRPLKSLAEAMRQLPTFNTGQTPEELAFLETVLSRGPLGLGDALTEHNFPEGENLMLLVDQFEELFRTTRGDSLGEAQAFVDLLLASARLKQFHVYVVLTMRSDFLGKCPVLRGLPEELNKSQFLIPRLNREQLRDAIKGPAAVAPIDTEIQPEVVNRILNAMGTDPDQLPLMQHLLMRMWRLEKKKVPQGDPILLTLESYHQIGGLRNCLSLHADNVFQEFSPQQQKLAELVFRRLTDVTPDRRLVRNFVRLADLYKVLPIGDMAERAALRTVIDELRREGRSFLVPPLNIELTDDSVVDISHESLIRQWQRLNEWAFDESKSRQIQKLVRDKAARWKENGKNVSFLLFGVELAEAQAWYKRFATQVESEEKDLIDASGKQNEENVRRDEAVKYTDALKTKTHWLIGAIVLIAILLVTSITFAILALQDASRATQKEAVAKQEAARRRAVQLASEANSRALVSPHFGLLLAVEARKVAEKMNDLENRMARERAIHLENHKFPAAEHAFHKALSIFNRYGITSRALPGPEAGITAAANQGKWLLTGGEDEAIRLWDLEVHAQIGFAPAQLARLSAIALDPTGIWAAAGFEDGTLRLWRSKKLSNPMEWRAHASKITDLKFNRQNLVPSTQQALGHWLVTLAEDGTACRWNLNNQDKLQATAEQFVHPGKIVRIAIGNDGYTLVTGSMDGRLRVWDLRTNSLSAPGKELFQPGPLTDIAISEDVRWLASGSADGYTGIWRLADNKEYKHVEFPPSQEQSSDVRAVTFAKGSGWVAVGRSNGHVDCWKLPLPSETTMPNTFQPRDDGRKELAGVVKGIAFDPKGDWLASIVENSRKIALQRFDVKQGRIGRTMLLEGHDEPVTQIFFTRPDNEAQPRLVSTGADGMVRLWELSSENTVRLEDELGQKLVPTTFTAENQALTIVRQKTTKNQKGTQLQFEFRASKWDPNGKRWKDDGKLVLNSDVSTKDGKSGTSSAFADTVPKVAQAGSLLAVAPTQQEFFKYPLYLRDLNKTNAKFVAVQIAPPTDEGNLQQGQDQEDKKTRSPIGEIALNYQTNGLGAVDGYVLAVVSKSNRLRVWELLPKDLDRDVVANPPHLISTLRGGELADLKLSPDSRWVACSNDGQALVWKVGSKEKVLSPPSEAEPGEVEFSGSHKNFHKGRLSALAFSQFDQPTKWLATGDDQGQVLLWNLSNRRLKPVNLEGATSRITAICFSPKGNWVAALTGGGIYIWELREILPWRSANAPVKKMVDWRGYVGVRFAFDPKERSVVVALEASEGQLVGQWQLEDLRPDGKAAPYQYFRGHDTTKLSHLGFLLDGEFITASADGEVRKWWLATETPSAEALAYTIGRNYTYKEWEALKDWEAVDDVSHAFCPFQMFPPHETVVKAFANSSLDHRRYDTEVQKLQQLEKARLRVKRFFDSAQQNPAALAPADYERLSAQEKELAANLVANESATLKMSDPKKASQLLQVAMGANPNLRNDLKPGLAGSNEYLQSRKDVELTYTIDDLLQKKIWQKALLAYEKLEKPSKLLSRTVAGLHLDFAEDYARKVDWFEAEKHLGRAWEISRALGEQDMLPSKEQLLVQLRNRLASEKLSVALVRLKEGSPKEAAQSYREAQKFVSYLKEEPTAFVQRLAGIKAERLIADAVAAAEQGETKRAKDKFREAQECERSYQAIDPDQFVKKAQARAMVREQRHVIESDIDNVKKGDWNELAGRFQFDAPLDKLREAVQLDPELGIDPSQYVNLVAGRRLLMIARLFGLMKDTKTRMIKVLEEATKRLNAAGSLPNEALGEFDPDSLYLRYAGLWSVLLKDGGGSLLNNTTADTVTKRLQKLKSSEAILFFEQMRAVDPLLFFTAETMNDLCWNGCLNDPKNAKRYRAAGQLAVLFEPENEGYHDSLGLAKVLTGDLDGAIADFQFFAARTPKLGERDIRLRLIENLKLVRSKTKSPDDVLNQDLVDVLQGIVFNKRGELTEQSELDAVNKDSYRKVYTVPLLAGRSYSIKLNGEDHFTGELRVETSQGVQIAHGEADRSTVEVTLQPVVDDKYRIIVTTAAPLQTGHFKLTITKSLDGPVLEVNGKLTVLSLEDRGREGSYGDTFDVQLEKSTHYEFRLNSKYTDHRLNRAGFDAYLRLTDFKGTQLAFDDDSGGNRNALISYIPSQSGKVRIVATTFAPGETGHYVLTVRVVPQPEK
jgi:WD40 repeat protein/energy-coupling factor transporter ATP-binding protein EcfA2